MAQVFDTHKASGAGVIYEFIKNFGNNTQNGNFRGAGSFLNPRNGHIVVAACKYECV